MGLTELVELSRQYGRGDDYVIAGGGNTSFKDDAFLYIKPSGTTLAELTESSMVRMRRDRLEAIWRKSYPRNPAKREEAALADLMASRDEGQELRPSVETLLHELLARRYVVHTHPALVNGLTCSREGERAAGRLFPAGMLWIPVVNPGYVLAAFVRRSVERHLARGGAYPTIVFLQNHGVFVSADSVEEVRGVYERIMSALGERIARRADLGEAAPEEGDRAGRAGELLAELVAGGATRPLFLRNREIVRLVSSRRAFAPIRSLSYTPDHIVYCAHEPLWVPDPGLEETIASRLDRYRWANGHNPRIVAVERLGVFVCGENEARIQAARAMFLDALKVVAYAESFGGARLMPRDKRDFIRTWEVERYRAELAGAKRSG